MATAPTKPLAPHREDITVISGQESIFFVEDEPEISLPVKSEPPARGYTLFTHSTAETALGTCSDRRVIAGVLVTDVLLFRGSPGARLLGNSFRNSSLVSATGRRANKNRKEWQDSTPTRTEFYDPASADSAPYVQSSSHRLEVPVFSYMFDKCFSTVLVLIASAAAISLLD